MAMRRMIVRASSWVIWSPTVELPLHEGANAQGPRQTFQLAFPRPSRSAVRAIFFRRRHQPRRPPLAKRSDSPCEWLQRLKISYVVFSYGRHSTGDVLRYVA